MEDSTVKRDDELSAETRYTRETGNELMDKTGYEDKARHRSAQNEENLVANVGDTECCNQSQMATTLNWLHENYEQAEGVSMPRCAVYAHYVHFCSKSSITPTAAATFGKLLRHNFPKLTTRRLGTRGQSKYHYYGIAIKDTSSCYSAHSGGKGLTRFSGKKLKIEWSTKKYLLSPKSGLLLPEFPNASEFAHKAGIDRIKMQTFVMMYSAHSQRIFDTVISANFDEVRNFLIHFWKGMPAHLEDMLDTELIVDVIASCDMTVYNALTEVLIPATIQDIPQSLAVEINDFTDRLPNWLIEALEDVNSRLKNVKLNAVKTFIQGLRRQMTFIHLAQAARPIVTSDNHTRQMLADIADVHVTAICQQSAFTGPNTPNSLLKNIYKHYSQLKVLLSRQSTVEAYTDWMEDVIDSCLLQGPRDEASSFHERAAQFLLHWTYVTSLVMRELTLTGARSFGSFHLLHMMLSEYILLVIDTKTTNMEWCHLERVAEKCCTDTGRPSV